MSFISDIKEDAVYCKLRDLEYRRTLATDDEIIYHYRRSTEQGHSLMTQQRFFRAPMEIPIPTDPPLPQIPLFHLQDCCNKAVPIYWYKHIYPEGTMQRRPEDKYLARPEDIWNAIHEWFFVDGHSTDVEFQRFVAKSIQLQGAQVSPLKVEDLLMIHANLGDQITEIMSYSAPDWGKEHWTGERKENGLHLFDEHYHKYFKLQPLFQALIILIDDRLQSSQIMLVNLILTGKSEGLSAPINFEAIRSEIRNQSPDGTVVTIPLKYAIRFVMELERREREAFPDPTYILGQEVAGLEALVHLHKFAEQLYGRQPATSHLQGPSSTWVKNSEVDAVIGPVTGTSIMFAKRRAGKMPKSWTDFHGPL